MTRCEVCGVAPEGAGGHGHRFGVGRLDHEQATGSQDARGLAEQREERVDWQVLDDVQGQHCAE
jgi:hypothetical protein